MPIRKFIPGAAAVLLAACTHPPTERSGQVVDRLPAAQVPASGRPASLSLDDIARLAAEGQDSEAILGRLRQSPGRFRLSAADVVSLKGRGVPLAVIDHLLDGERRTGLDDCAQQINQREAYARDVLAQAEVACQQRCSLSCPPAGGWLYYRAPYWRRWP